MIPPWARGQAWGVYGYTSCYRESKDAAFLQQAQNIAALIMERVKTDDAIPLWDYDAPNTPETPRDASAASITASALIELSTLVEDGQVYLITPRNCSSLSLPMLTWQKSAPTRVYSDALYRFIA